MKPRFMKPEDLSRRLGVPRRTVREWCSRGMVLSAAFSPRCYRIPRVEMVRVLRRFRAEGNVDWVEPEWRERERAEALLASIDVDRGRPKVEGVYIVSGGGLFKIGKSRDPERRFRNLCTMSPVPLRLECYGMVLRGFEGTMHETFADFRHHGEWFDLPEEEFLVAVSMVRNCSEQGTYEERAA